MELQPTVSLTIYIAGSIQYIHRMQYVTRVHSDRDLCLSVAQLHRVETRGGAVRGYRHGGGHVSDRLWYRGAARVSQNSSTLSLRHHRLVCAERRIPACQHQTSTLRWDSTFASGSLPISDWWGFFSFIQKGCIKFIKSDRNDIKSFLFQINFLFIKESWKK